MKIIISERQINKIINELHSSWKEVGGKLTKTYKFPTYKDVIDFVNKVSEVAEEQNHHPEMVVEYDSVKLIMFDHEQKKISDKCHKFAKAIDKMVDSDESLDERSRSLANTRKKRLFPKSAMMTNPNRFKKYDKEVKDIDEGLGMLARIAAPMAASYIGSKMANEEEKPSSKDLFDEFADKRMGGAQKIANTAKEKGGPSMLTYHHFVVKLPYYKEASEGKFDMEDAKKEFTKTLKSISLNMNQTDFQTEVGRLEVLGELIIKHKGK